MKPDDKIKPWGCQNGRIDSALMNIIYSALTEALEQAIHDEQQGVGLTPLQQHDKLKDIYKWSDVARRTEIVYDRIHKQDVITPKYRINKWVIQGVVSSWLTVAL